MWALTVVGLTALTGPNTARLAIPVAPAPRELPMLHRPPAKAGEFAGKTLAQWEAEVRSGDDQRRILAASAAYAWGREAAPLAKAFIETVPVEKREAGARYVTGTELDYAALFRALGPKAAPALVEGLKSRRIEVRSAAIYGLSDIRPVTPEAVAALTAALDDPERENWWAAAVGLGEMGPAARAALPALSRRVYGLALYNLPRPSVDSGRLFDWVAVDAAFKIDPHFWPVVFLRTNSLLAWSGDGRPTADQFRFGPNALPLLAVAVRRSDPKAVKGRWFAVEACQTIGPRSAPVLMEVIRKERSVFRDTHIGTPAVWPKDAALMHHDPASAALGYSARTFIQWVAAERRLNDPGNQMNAYTQSGAAVEALARFGADAKGVEPELRRWLRGTDPSRRCDAMYILAATGDREARAAAFATFKKYAQKSGVWGGAYQTIITFAHAGDEEAHAAILDVLKDKKSEPWAREVAIKVLSELRDPAVIPFAVAELDPAPNPLTPIAEAAITALGRFGPVAKEKAAPVLRKLIDRGARYDDHHGLPALALMRIDPTEVGPYRVWADQIDLFLKINSYVWPELDREVHKNRDHALRAMAKFPTEPRVPSFQRMLCAIARLDALEDSHHAKFAEIAIVDRGYKAENGELFRILLKGGRSSAPVLARLLEHKDPLARRAAARALTGLGRAAEPAAKALARRAADEPEGWVREWVVFALRNVDPKVALPALRAALKDTDERVRLHAAVALTDLDPDDPAVAKALFTISRPARAGREPNRTEAPEYLTKDGWAVREYGQVRDEALYRTDPEAAVRAGVPCPFVLRYPN